MAATVTVAPRAYVSPSKQEQAVRARGELKAALAALKRDGWARSPGAGWAVARTGELITSLNLHLVEDGRLELAGWTLTGALRAHCRDQLGNHYAERYLARVLPCDVSHFGAHPFTDQVDATRALQKALDLASSDAGVTDLPERTARGAAASPSPPRRVRSGCR